MNEIKLGAVTVTRIEEMRGPLGMTPRELFPGMPEQTWQRHADLLIPDHLADDIVNVAMQTWLVRSEGQTILIDIRGRKRQDPSREWRGVGPSGTAHVPEQPAPRRGRASERRRGDQHPLAR